MRYLLDSERTPGICMQVGSIWSWSVVYNVHVHEYIVYNRAKAQPQLEKVRHDTKIKMRNCEYSNQL